jgi:hypothetical protein
MVHHWRRGWRREYALPHGSARRMLRQSIYTGTGPEFESHVTLAAVGATLAPVQRLRASQRMSSCDEVTSSPKSPPLYMQEQNINLILPAIIAVIITVFTSGCASIVHGGPRNIVVNSQPTGAKVAISKFDTGEVVHGGTTPFTVSLSPRRGFFKGQSYDLRIELPGHRLANVTVRSEISGWYFGNILFGGLIGMLIVDPATGAMWNLTPQRVDQSLSPDQASLLQDGDGFMVVLLPETTARERASMVRIN